MITAPLPVPGRTGWGFRCITRQLTPQQLTPWWRTRHRALNEPLFYPAKPPAHWLMCAEVSGQVLVVPLAPSRNGDPRRCRPIGCY